jgi:hypothetical protein
MRKTARMDVILLRFILMLVATSMGWIIIGSSLLICGLVWGLNSHQISYVQGGQGTYQIFISEDNSFICFQQNGTNNYYVMYVTNYTPFADPATIQSELQSHSRLFFLASTDTIKIDSQIVGNNTFVASAHPIGQITLLDSNGENPVTYTNPVYAEHPTGYTVNNWPYASLLILAGVICDGISIFFLVLSRQRRKLARAAEMAELEARPSPFARELGEGSMPMAPQMHQEPPI